MPELVINISSIISSLCHSLLRLESYTICPYKCLYCYSKWYMTSPATIVYPRRFILDQFNTVMRKIYRRGLKYIPFRLSTLVDPFPHHEELYRFTEKLLKIASIYEYPLIINTKSSLIARKPWIDLIIKLAKGNAILIQISVSTLKDEIGKKLEPSAPPPSQRLIIAKKLSELGIPISIRLSPFIPFVSPTLQEEIREAVDTFKECGVKHVIFEGLRIEPENYSQLVEAASSIATDFEDYSIRKVKGLKSIVRISRDILEPIYRTYARLLSKNSIAFATCKEGLFNLHTSEDCCGFYILKNCVRRPTLWDVYKFVLEYGALEPDRIIRSICKEGKLICSSNLDGYPKEISKPLKYHERKLLKILHNKDILEHLTPVLGIDDGKVVIKMK
ncbi:MAG: radical SAM protein [Ignisphaera sp.]